MVHLAAGLALLLERPTAVISEPVISVLLVARPPPVSSAITPRPTPLRLHQHPQETPPPDVPTAPIAAPTPPGANAPPAHGPVALHPSPLPEGPRGDVRAALRHSYVGCADRDLVGLNKAERDLCDERFGKGARDAKFAGLGLSPEKQRLLDAAAARKDADYRYKNGPATAQPLGRSRLPGATAEGMAGDLGNDRPVLKVPF